MCVLPGQPAPGGCSGVVVAERPGLERPQADPPLRVPRRRPTGIRRGGETRLGDSGRHGLDLLLFAEMTRLGYPVALISSPALAASFPDGEANSEGLSRDLDVASRAAARELLLAEDVPFLLLGQSRGAGLAVEAAVEPSLRRRLSGVVALGLCEDEVVVRDHGGWARPYRDRARLGDLPLEVIQSTHDRFFPADAARAALGPTLRGSGCHAIQARSHTFVGNRGALLEQLAASLERVAR